MTRSERLHRAAPFALGLAFLLHALAHAAVAANGVLRITTLGGPTDASENDLALWFNSLLAAISISAFAMTGLGLLSVRVFRPYLWRLAAAGMFASLGLLVIFDPAGFLVGGPIGGALLYALSRLPHFERPSAAAAPRSTGRIIAATAWVLLVAGVAGATALRPIFLRWGTTPAETSAPLPGDTERPGGGFQILHAVTINARPDQVWPWLAQIGHDRGGFYSYAWLENAFGLDIVNADRIVPKWQHRRIGELLPATPPNWLGLVREPIGWRVRAFEPNRLLVLENWGAFALVPIDSARTRFYIRTLGPAGQRASLLTSPIELLVFEPTHFIMQRRMMLGIKERAEDLARSQHARSALRAEFK